MSLGKTSKAHVDRRDTSEGGELILKTQVIIFSKATSLQGRAINKYIKDQVNNH